MKPTYLAIGIIVLALVGGLAAGALRGPQASPVLSASDWVLRGVFGGEGRLSDYRGQVILINFWASWCGTCREEMPDIIETWQKYRDLGFVVIGINYDEAEGDARDFAQTYGMEFPIFLDPGKKVASQYGVISMPTSYLLSTDGEVKEFIPGKIDFDELTPRIEELLKK